ncbi:hypothetical protein [Bacillus sp. alh8]
MSIDDCIKRVHSIKTDLLKAAQSIDHCKCNEDREMYQNVTLCYAKALKDLNEVMEDKYGIQVCKQCSK